MKYWSRLVSLCVALHTFIGLTLRAADYGLGQNHFHSRPKPRVLFQVCSIILKMRSSCWILKSNTSQTALTFHKMKHLLVGRQGMWHAFKVILIPLCFTHHQSCKSWLCYVTHMLFIPWGGELLCALMLYEMRPHAVEPLSERGFVRWMWSWTQLMNPIWDFQWGWCHLKSLPHDNFWFNKHFCW